MLLIFTAKIRNHEFAASPNTDFTYWVFRFAHNNESVTSMPTSFVNFEHVG